MKRIALSAVLLVLGPAPAFADGETLSSPYGLASSPVPHEKLWVKVTRSSNLKEIADDLYLATSDLIALNDQSSFETILAGSWVAIPYTSQANLSVATRVSRTEYKLKPPEHLQSVVRIKANESLSTFSRDQGVSLSELRSLNPGLDLARLAIAREVRVAKASPRALLAIRPTVSGGASFPALPALPGISNDGIAIFQGGSLSAFAAKHNVSLSELRSLNPGLDLARLHEGMEVRVSKSSPYLRQLQQKREQIKRDQERRRREDAARASAQRARAKAERARAENERMEREALSRINRAKQSIQNSY